MGWFAKLAVGLMQISNWNRPPRVAEKLIGALSDPDDRDVILGDFAEEFGQICNRRGRSKAWVWYWLQFFRSGSASNVMKTI